MTTSELKDFIFTTYPSYFAVEGTNEMRFEIVLNKALFPKEICISNDTILNVYGTEGTVSVYDLISLEGFYDGGLPFIESYKSRNLDLKTLNEFMLRLVLDNVVNSLTKIQKQIKDYNANKKLESIKKDF
jgi:hypothetical protein